MNGEQEHLLIKIYTYGAAAVFLLMFINLGTVLDWQRFKNALKSPVGPLLGFCSRFLLMPALSLALGQIFLRKSKELQISLLYTAISPSGGLANIFTIFLKGNIGLSLTTTSFNSLLALAMLPLWIIVIVPATFNGIEVDVPIGDLATSAAIIILAVLFGVALRSCVPKTTRFVFRFLKPISIVLSFLLVGLTIGMHFYVFKELSWQISVTVILLPFIGYLFSFGLSKLCCRTTTDALTIAIETSVLSTTLPILLLRHGFAEDQINSIIVIPITSSLASLCLALLLYIVRRICGWNTAIDEDGFDEKHLLTNS